MSSTDDGMLEILTIAYCDVKATLEQSGQLLETAGFAPEVYRNELAKVRANLIAVCRGINMRVIQAHGGLWQKNPDYGKLASISKKLVVVNTTDGYTGPVGLTYALGMLLAAHEEFEAYCASSIAQSAN